MLVGYGVKLGTTDTTATEGRERGRWIRGWTGSGRGRESCRLRLGTGRRGGVDRPLAKPPVRKLAKDLGVDLAALTGSGPEGTITREDVQAAAADPRRGAGGHAGPAVTAGGEERIPVRGVRKHTAAAVTASAFTAPHVTEFLQIDVTETMRRCSGCGTCPSSRDAACARCCWWPRR